MQAAVFLTSGRLLNQAEVGSENPERPPELERAVWTIDTNDLADLRSTATSPRSATSATPDGGPLTRKTLHDTYGAARLIYKPELRSRSTITAGDSLWLLHQRRAAPAAFSAPSWLAFPPDADYIGEREDADHCIATDFIECQTLGGVYVEDIAHVIFDAIPEPETEEALTAARIPWSVANTS